MGIQGCPRHDWVCIIRPVEHLSGARREEKISPGFDFCPEEVWDHVSGAVRAAEQIHLLVMQASVEFNLLPDQRTPFREQGFEDDDVSSYSAKAVLHHSLGLVVGLWCGACGRP